MGGITINSYLGNINLAQSIAEHHRYDIDTISKPVVRHTKTIDSMKQVFPTWSNEPDYRCIHCFSYDIIFIPQQFMINLDDGQMINIQPLDMTPT
ncbi:unnamed protein product [Rotaria sp. Silwood2]|nr:unnamed protein product [Rotaria sp. Silwood2]CAF3987409.1 unnamed protein product [Rotaria sp. Silwood2]CAF4097151.1 unnamed protein product [Rotaria sp. Silwood2]CAF4249828.1 unnamed protein product [Rotaria sp. Silwood2]